MNKYLKLNDNWVEVLNRTIRPAILGRAPSRIYVTQQDLQAARASTSLARVLGLGHLDCQLART